MVFGDRDSIFGDGTFPDGNPFRGSDFHPDGLPSFVHIISNGRSTWITPAFGGDHHGKSGGGLSIWIFNDLHLFSQALSLIHVFHFRGRRSYDRIPPSPNFQKMRPSFPKVVISCD